MWSSLKSSLKSAAAEIVREAEERERKEKAISTSIKQVKRHGEAETSQNEINRLEPMGKLPTDSADQLWISEPGTVEEAATFFSTPHHDKRNDDRKRELERFDSIDLDSPTADIEVFQDHPRELKKNIISETDSPISLAVKGTFEHLSKLKSLTSSVIASTIPADDEKQNENLPKQDSSVYSEADALIGRVQEAKLLMHSDTEHDKLFQADEEVQELWSKLKRVSELYGNDFQGATNNIDNGHQKLDEQKHNGTEESTSYERKWKDAQRELAKVIEESKMLKKSLSEKESHIQNLKNSLDIAKRHEQEKIQNLEDKLQVQREQIEQNEKEMGKLQEIRTTENSTSKTLADTIADLNHTIDAKQTLLDKSTAEVRTLSKEKLRLQRLVEARTQKDEEVLRDTLETNNVTLGEMNRSIQKAREKETSYRENIAKLEKLKEQQENSLKEMKCTLETLQTNLEVLKNEEERLQYSVHDVFNQYEFSDKIFNDAVLAAINSYITGSGNVDTLSSRSKLSNIFNKTMIEVLRRRVVDLYKFIENSRNLNNSLTMIEDSQDENGIESIASDDHLTKSEVTWAVIQAILDCVRTMKAAGLSINDFDSEVLNLMAEKQKGYAKTDYERILKEIERVLSSASKNLKLLPNLICTNVSVEEKVQLDKSDFLPRMEALIGSYSRILNKQNTHIKNMDYRYSNLCKASINMLVHSVRLLWLLSKEEETRESKELDDKGIQVGEVSREELCDRNLVANLVTICIERNCRHDCLEIVARVLGFTAEQRKRVGLDTSESFWASFIPNLSRGQARAQQMDMSEQSLSDLLSDFVRDETS